MSAEDDRLADGHRSTDDIPAPDADAKAAEISAREGGWRELLKTEDWWTIWLGFALIVAGLLIYLPRAPEGMERAFEEGNAALQREADRAPFRTVAWYNANDAKQKPKAAGTVHGTTITSFTAKPHGWKNNPLVAFHRTDDQTSAAAETARPAFERVRAEVAALKVAAGEAEALAAAAGFGDEALNIAAESAIMEWRNRIPAESGAKKKTRVDAYNQLPRLFLLGLALGLFFAVGLAVMGHSPVKFFLGFQFVFWLAVLAYLFAAQATMKQYGIGKELATDIFDQLVSEQVLTRQPNGRYMR